ncbi:MAG: TetR/AcrR family transcriptional regulator [Candidatus Thermofonsia Clade 1 bacterium]|uniref:TetR/AcrR family transcriptional regulator n=1 Tax=Candidatus Thermofonsia Clade 1 bacterium TaxID=2364210 RepID=A0A2M8NY84_9CHLR|nr:MAG: TetR/AcrR family transcriptional regulator [Candidatus Thermofonsia Clade 1 bacterium]
MHTDSESRKRVLDAAERLFMERGYAAVTLRDIAQALNIKPASLYYHEAGGKEALFVAVVERSMARHSEGLRAALCAAGGSLREKLLAAAEWLFSQPPMDFGRMMHSDLSALSPEQAARLERAIYDSLLVPLEAVFVEAHAKGEIWSAHAQMLSGMVLVMLEAAHSLPTRLHTQPKQVIAAEMIEVLLKGLQPR